MSPDHKGNVLSSRKQTCVDDVEACLQPFSGPKSIEPFNPFISKCKNDAEIMVLLSRCNRRAFFIPSNEQAPYFERGRIRHASKYAASGGSDG